MSDERVFTSMSSPKMVGLINRAQTRVLLCSPAIRTTVAEAFIGTSDRIGKDKVRAVLDCDEEVYRLGYGEIEAVQKLREAGVDVRQSSGLRVGLLIVDGDAWVFTPTALFVQSEVHSDETPNSIKLPPPDAERLARSICPPDTGDEQCDADAEIMEPEVGHASLDDKTIATVTQGLEVAPPIPFDVARQVRVFQPYLQYVKTKLSGSSLQTHRVTIPDSLQDYGSDSGVAKRLRTTFNLIGTSSDLSSKPLADKLRKINRDLTRPLGEPWGRVLLKAARKAYDEEIESLKEELQQHQDLVKKKLKEQLAKSRKEVVEYYFPIVKENPPNALIGQMLTRNVTEEQIRWWIDHELSKVFPTPEQLISAMNLEVHYSDVTYETLNHEGFADALQKAYPHINWDKPFDEFNAAKGKSQT